MHSIHYLKIRTRFLILLGLFTLGFLVYALWSFKTINELRVNGPLYQQIVQTKDLVADILPPPRYIIESYLVTFQMLNSEDESERKKLIERLGGLKTEFEARNDYWKKQPMDQQMSHLLLKESYETATNFYRLAFEQMIPALQNGDAPAAAEAMKKMTAAYESHRKAIDQVVTMANAQGMANEQHAHNTSQSAWRWLIGILMTSLLVCVGVSLLIVKSIVSPLVESVKLADTFALGDLTASIKVEGDSEISQLQQALQTMKNNLTTTVSGVLQSADSVATASAQIAQGNSDLASRTEREASALEEAASSMDELSTTARHNAESAEMAHRLVHNASDVAEQGGQVVSKVVVMMEDINQSSRKIADILSVIDGIAFQTNILALNAAVEAARAGEQGKGFAVVASEVRSLANRSASASKEIKDLIDRNVESVGHGTDLVHQAGSTMQQIVLSIHEVSSIISRITNSSSEQSAGVNQVTQAVNQMDQATQQNAALVEEMAAGANNLRLQAQDLVQVVSQFKIAHPREKAVHSH